MRNAHNILKHNSVSFRVYQYKSILDQTTHHTHAWCRTQRRHCTVVCCCIFSTNWSKRLAFGEVNFR